MNRPRTAATPARVFLSALLFLIGLAPAVLATGPAAAQELALDLNALSSKALLDRLKPADLKLVFPRAEELEVVEGAPPAVAVRIGGEIVGYIFSTRDTVRTTGYSGQSFDLVAGMKLDGTITGAALLRHREAIVGRGVPQARLDGYVAGFALATLDDFGPVRPDVLNAATVSARLMKGGVRNAAQLVFAGHVARTLDLPPPVTSPMLNRGGFGPIGVVDLVGWGSLGHRTLTVGEVIAAFEKKGGRGAHPDLDLSAAGKDDTFIEFYTALVTPATVGINILGDRRQRGVVALEGDDGLTVWVASKGLFPFVPDGLFMRDADFVFDQVKIVQGNREFQFDTSNGRLTNPIAGLSYVDALFFDTAMLFTVPAEAGLDPFEPFDVVLMVPGTDRTNEATMVEFPITYTLPNIHKLLPPPAPPPMWLEAWIASENDLSILAALLIVVTLVFVFQDALVRRRRLFGYLRIAVLSFTLGWLGFYAGGQISVVNLWAYLQAPFNGAGLDALMLEPLMFVLAVYTLITLFVLGRGVFCGWLCPFGALQELLNKVARVLRLPQVKVPSTLQERLWALKYIAAVVVIGTVFFAVEYSDAAAEIEPFKTVITVKLQRDWPFVMYALVMLGAGLFVERFYCRFLCPLGGSLGIFGRMHMFRWLKRRPQCGTECRICEADCPLGTISASGEINMNECLQCLDCQVNYYDAQRCPPLINRRKRKEARAAALAGPGPLLPEAAPAE